MEKRLERLITTPQIADSKCSGSYVTPSPPKLYSTIGESLLYRVITTVIHPATINQQFGWKAMVERWLGPMAGRMEYEWPLRTIRH